MKALVTGAAGFIGSHVVDTFRSDGFQVIGLDSLDPGVFQRPPSYLRPDVDYWFQDLRQFSPDSRFDDVEVVVHLAALGGVSRAAKETANVLTANAGGTACLLDAARRWPKLKRIILASSFSVYGSNYRYSCMACGNLQWGVRRNEDMDSGRFDVLCEKCGSNCRVLPITEDTSPDPLETYGASKYMQELALRGFTACPVTIFRFSSVYGSRLRVDDGEATIIAKLAGWIRSGVTPNLYEDGLQLRDWVYVGDVTAAMLAVLAAAESTPRIINVCSGVGTSLRDACQILSPVIGVSCEPKVVSGYRAGDMRHCLGDTTRIRALLGRDPVTFSAGAGLAFRDLR